MLFQQQNMWAFGCALVIICGGPASSMPFNVGNELSQGRFLLHNIADNTHSNVNDPNTKCRSNPDCSDALDRYRQALATARNEQEIYRSAVRKAFITLYKDEGFASPISKTLTDIGQITELSERLGQELKKDDYKLLLALNNINTVIRTFNQEGISTDTWYEHVYNAILASKAMDLSNDTGLGFPDDTYQKISDLYQLLRDAKQLPLTQIKQFIDQFQNVEFLTLRDKYKESQNLLAQAEKDACLHGAVIPIAKAEECKKERPENVTPQTVTPKLEIEAAIYGAPDAIREIRRDYESILKKYHDFNAFYVDLGAWDEKAMHPDAMKIRNTTCNATGYFKTKCEYREFVLNVCIKRAPAPNNTVTLEVLPRACLPAEKANTAEYSEYKLFDIDRRERDASLCISDVNVQEVCGGFNPASSVDRAVWVKYNCNSNNKSTPHYSYGRDNEKIYLECPQ